MIANTDRSDRQGTYWWSILDIDGKKDFLLFDSFGIKGLKVFYLSETCADFLHFLESFADYENQSLIHLWLLEDPIQDITTNTCGYFQPFFTKTFFYPDSDSILHKRKIVSYDVIQTFFPELFTTNTKQNERIIRHCVEQKGNITR